MASKIDGSSFSGLFTRVEIGHIRIGPAGNGRIKSRGSSSSPKPTSVIARRKDQRHPVMDFRHQFVRVDVDNRERPTPFAGNRLFRSRTVSLAIENGPSRVLFLL
jgi:hypothetical protein